jgi:hypothetical protein
MNTPIRTLRNGATRLAIAALAATFPLSAQAILQGLVLDDAGQPVAGAFVTATRVHTGGPTFSQTDTTAANGSFSIENIPAADYTVCVQGTGILNPCQWSLFPTVVTLADGQVMPDLQVVVVRGSPLSVHVKDDRKLLSTNEGKTHGAQLLVGVWTDRGLFYPASVRTKKDNSRDYTIQIPDDTDLTLEAHSTFFKLADATPGKSSAMVDNKGLKIHIKHAKNDQAPSFTVQITDTQP